MYFLFKQVLKNKLFYKLSKNFVLETLQKKFVHTFEDFRSCLNLKFKQFGDNQENLYTTNKKHNKFIFFLQLIFGYALKSLWIETILKIPQVQKHLRSWGLCPKPDLYIILDFNFSESFWRCHFDILNLNICNNNRGQQASWRKFNFKKFNLMHSSTTCNLQYNHLN